MDGPTFDAKRFKKNPDINNYSGLGSTIENTEEVRKSLSDIIKKYNIKSIIDAPCGDCSWIKLVNMSHVDYHGFDILDIVLDQAKMNYPMGTFSKLDIAKHSFPPVDLIICRDFLFHISFKKALQAIEKFKESGSRYLLTSSFWCGTHNDLIQNGAYKRIENYSFRQINLRLKPFCLPEPIFMFTEMEGLRYMGLWILN